MAATAPTGEIWLGTIAKFTLLGVMYESMLENYGGLQINSLNHILSSNNDEVPDVIQQSNYYDQESLAGIFHHKH